MEHSSFGVLFPCPIDLYLLKATTVGNMLKQVKCAFSLMLIIMELQKRIFKFLKEDQISHSSMLLHHDTFLSLYLIKMLKLVCSTGWSLSQRKDSHLCQ